MNVALTICMISLVVCAVILFNKNKELSKGRSMLSFSPKLDAAVQDAIEMIVYACTHASVKTAEQLFKRAVIGTERFLLGQFDRVSHRFVVVSDVVTGKHIPKNRGSVSFFLKNIETSKKSRPAR